MNRIEQLFASLKQSGQTALMPFIAAGDPRLSTTTAIIEQLAAAGCHLCELGFPYSDPIADGPTIQAGFTRALAGGVRVQDILETVRQLHENGGTPMPIVAMLSYSIVYRWGAAKFAAEANRAGFSGLIVPDLPCEESTELNSLCRQNDLCLIPLVTPTTTPDRLQTIVANGSGFIYYVSVAGVTGERTTLPAGVTEQLARLRQMTPLPICVGFGISTAEQVKQLAPHADGLIVGSAIVKRIEQAVVNNADDQSIANSLAEFCRALLSTAMDCAMMDYTDRE